MMDNLNKQNTSTTPELVHLDRLAALLDNRFRIPGTDIRFGLDGIIGLVPYAGDIAGFVVSGFLMRIMLRHGAGPVLMLRMMGNFAFDALVGVIPIAGDLFDFGYKANRRNVDLLKKYYEENTERQSAKGSIAILGFLFFITFVAMVWGIWKLAALLVAWVWSLI